MRQFAIFPGLYDLGSGRNQTLLNLGFLDSFLLNTRDVFTKGSADYPAIGPGSQVWIVGYSLRVSRPFPFPPPANQTGLQLRISGSYDEIVPFNFGEEQRIILPVRTLPHHYAGRARIESPVVQFEVFNNTGNDLEVSYQFWGKAL